MDGWVTIEIERVKGRKTREEATEGEASVMVQGVEGLYVLVGLSESGGEVF